MSVNEKMTAIADEIRALTNTTDKIGLDAMKTHLADANTEVTEQATKLAELKTILQGKAAGGATLETCNVTITGCQYVVYTGVENGNCIEKVSEGSSTSATHSFIACKNTPVTCCVLKAALAHPSYGGSEIISTYMNRFAAFKIINDETVIDLINGDRVA